MEDILEDWLKIYNIKFKYFACNKLRANESVSLGEERQ